MFPRSVPRPLMLSRHRSFPTLVTTGIPLAPLGALSMRAPQRGLRQSLAVFFARQPRFRIDATVAAFAAHPRGVRGSAGRVLRTASGTLLQRDRDRRRPAARGAAARRLLGQQPRDARRLPGVVDWEDFGRECLPGYDLPCCCLLLNGFSVARVREIRWTVQSMHGSFRRVAKGPAYRGPVLRLLPAYLALTLRMKTELAYGPGLRSLVIPMRWRNRCMETSHPPAASAHDQRSPRRW